ARRDAIAHFRRFAESKYCTPVFYEVGPDHLSDYLDNGFALFKLGEMGRVDLTTFAMTGKRNEDKRSALNRGHRLGLVFELTEPPLAAALITQLRNVSDAWLAAMPAATCWRSPP